MYGQHEYRNTNNRYNNMCGIVIIDLLQKGAEMNIRFMGIDGLGGHEVNRIFSNLKDFDFIKNVEIIEIRFHDTWGEVLNFYDVTIEIEPDRDDVSIHIFDNEICIVDCGCRHKAYIYIDRSAYEKVEII